MKLRYQGRLVVNFIRILIHADIWKTLTYKEKPVELDPSIQCKSA